jgi:hypothetical protein
MYTKTGPISARITLPIPKYPQAIAKGIGAAQDAFGLSR